MRGFDPINVKPISSNMIEGYFKSRITPIIPIYTIPTVKKSFVGAGKKVLMPRYDDAFFKRTENITPQWLTDRMDEVRQANSMPKELTLDIVDHSDADFLIAASWAKLAIKNNINVDLSILEVFAYAHDMGRMAVGGITPRFYENIATPYHGVAGREIFIRFADGFKKSGKKDLSTLCTAMAGVASGHTAGVGFTRDSNVALGILPHNGKTFEDDTIWSWFGQFTSYPLYFKERLLVTSADAVCMYPTQKLSYSGTAEILINNRQVYVLKPGEGLLADIVLSSVQKRSPNLSEPPNFSYLSPFKLGDTITIKFPDSLNTQKIEAIRTGKRSSTVTTEIKGTDGKISNNTRDINMLEYVFIANGEVQVQEVVKASQGTVHSRYDHFSPYNHANIARAFEEIVKMVGEENRKEVEDGWFDPERIPK